MMLKLAFLQAEPKMHIHQATAIVALLDGGYGDGAALRKPARSQQEKEKGEEKFLFHNFEILMKEIT